MHVFHPPIHSRRSQATFKDDLGAARAAISSEIIAGHDVILIAHSYGGVVANNVIRGFTSPQPGEGRIIGLLLIASSPTLTGLSFKNPLFHISPPTWRVGKRTNFTDIVTPPRQLFYPDLPVEGYPSSHLKARKRFSRVARIRMLAG